jgi:HD-like signal output (HDOD) protein
MSIITRLKEIQELPTLPEVVMRVQALVNSDTGNAQELARIVSEDPSLSAKILKVANSVYFGGSQRVSSITLAVARIGFNEVRNISVAVGLIRQFTRKSAILDYDLFWRHSLTAAYLTRDMAGLTSVRLADYEKELLFLSGLLHDAGLLILDQFFHTEFKAALDRSVLRDLPFVKAEEEISPDETHAAVGGALLELWRLEPAVASAVRFHHAPNRTPPNHLRYAALVALAEYVLCTRAIGSFEGEVEMPSPEVWSSAGISADSLGLLFTKAEIDNEKADAVLSAGSGSSEPRYA